MTRSENNDLINLCTSCTERLRNMRAEQSPFAKQVILDSYDGTLNGIVRCDACGTAYDCRIIDWDDKFEKRIFALSPLPEGVFDDVVRLSSRGVETPKWPIWAPKRLPNEAEHSDVDEAIESSLNQAGAPCLLVAADRYFQRIYATRVPETTLHEEIRKSNTPLGPNATRDWFEYMNIAR